LVGLFIFLVGWMLDLSGFFAVLLMLYVGHIDMVVLGLGEMCESAVIFLVLSFMTNVRICATVVYSLEGIFCLILYELWIVRASGMFCTRGILVWLVRLWIVVVIVLVFLVMIRGVPRFGL